ncbi:hypothetical protein SAMN06265348_105369 [Pedobacter westerhofensis]|uniref:Uncharacterized protein n=1 Tax=Pedobacter westerhofensis TaxID=425512 RepID=A0A521DH31_9SPHI|nr:DUF6266 family protein [Pedobacter westerhofensis]SMO70938.1 hypothetical protein SAMN06265348_105369 [Pedobacter westerhofensis]
MGLLDGAFGDFTGRIGNMVFYKLNGKIVGRTIGIVETYSEKQEEVRMRTQLISPFLTPLKDFIRVGFRNTPKPQDWDFYSVATSVNKPGAIKGIYPNLEINYKKVILSLGSVPSPKNPKVILNDNILEFSWEPDLDAGGADLLDQVMLVAYFPQTLKAVFITSGARRTAGTEKLKLPSFNEKTVIETYISFITDDRTDVSNSVYTGRLTWKKPSK